jgi:hypothetical protein
MARMRFSLVVSAVTTSLALAVVLIGFPSLPASAVDMMKVRATVVPPCFEVRVTGNWHQAEPGQAFFRVTVTGVEGTSGSSSNEITVQPQQTSGSEVVPFLGGMTGSGTYQVTGTLLNGSGSALATGSKEVSLPCIFTS